MYYLMSCSSKPRRRIKSAPFIKGLNWWRGAVISTQVPNPLEFELAPFDPFSEDDAKNMAPIMYTNPPLWRDDLIAALRGLGVNNFDEYPVSIKNPDNKAELDDYLDEMKDNGIDDPEAFLQAEGYGTRSDWLDADAGQVFTNYKAVNILGLVAAANMEESIATVHDGIPLIDVDFDLLVVDEHKTKGIKMFRLAESTNAILVHESLRDALIAKGFGDDIAFYDLKEAAL